ncbi:hypothetical protein B989_02227 [Brucella sp. 56/94]|nr:hypothetical protein B989_02227 [Brucella sp. 56/94]
MESGRLFCGLHGLVHLVATVSRTQMGQPRTRHDEMRRIGMADRQADPATCKCRINIDSFALAAACDLFFKADTCGNCRRGQFIGRRHAAHHMRRAFIIASGNMCFPALVAELYQTQHRTSRFAQLRCGFSSGCV